MKKLSIISMALIAGMAQAASDGDLSPDFTVAQMDVTASIDPVIAIYNVTDAQFGPFDMLDPYVEQSEGALISTSFCVYTNAQNYSLEITTAGFVSSGFYMVGETAYGDLPYTIDVYEEYFNASGASFERILKASDISPGAVIEDFTYSPDAYINNTCVTSDGVQNNVFLSMRISEEPGTLTNAAPDSYRDTLLITARASLNGMGDG